MTEINQHLPFLVVSSSPQLRKILKFVLESTIRADVTELESEEKALLFLKNLSITPSMIVYDYTPNSFLVEDFVGYLKDNSKGVRIVILVDSIREEGRDLLKNIPQIKLIKESDLPNELIKEAQIFFQNSSHINQDEYRRIDMDFLSILDGINKDLFIKLGQEKFVKVFNENESMSTLDYKKYRDKGIQYLYLHRDTALWVSEQIQKQMNIFLKASNFKFVLRSADETPEKRFEQKILRIEEEVHIDNDFRLTIEKAIENVKATVEKEKRVQTILSSFKENKKDYAFFTQKMNLTCLISCLLAKELDWMSKTTIDKLVYASVLGDITLAVKPHLMQFHRLSDIEKSKQHITDEERKIFITHPQDSSQLIKRYFSSAPSDTDNLALQHHEMPDGSGFPAGLKADKISPLSALFIVANDFATYYLSEEDTSLDEFLLRSQARYDFMNFRKIMKSLEKIRRK
jgi:response regulator RpfG family c-di-GMP phosphodiesterase